MGDFKKINEWESFWLMRNALRRDEKFPGVFYREVFDILDDGGGGKEEVLGRERRRRLSLIPAGAPRLVMDYSLILSSRITRSPVSVGVTPRRTINHLVKSLLVKVRIMREKMSQKLKFKAHRKEGKKRDAIDGGRETADLQHQLLEAVERKGKLLSSQFKARNTYLQLDREQQKDHANSLITVLNKLADSLGRIADKLQGKGSSTRLSLDNKYFLQLLE